MEKNTGAYSIPERLYICVMCYVIQGGFTLSGGRGIHAIRSEWHRGHPSLASVFFHRILKTCTNICNIKSFLVFLFLILHILYTHVVGKHLITNFKSVKVKVNPGIILCSQLPNFSQFLLVILSFPEISGNQVRYDGLYLIGG